MVNTQAPSAEQLWQFSLALYAKVQPLCLQWQDNFGLNVNLLLLLCYLEQHQLSLSSSQLQQLAATLDSFSRDFTKPLRQLRRNSSQAPLTPARQQQLKQALLKAELVAEQLEQQLLLAHCPPLSLTAKPLIELYLVVLNVDIPTLSGQLFDLRQALQQQR
ncbi:TIGR02444 family protein [Arsukibacterium sp.]|uniref:TIGR02444 family protein n=1 Tax=Arsukibacterium sp. TaxID=1977258 RepID=UPI002FDB7E92